MHQGQARGTGAVIIWDEGPADIRREEPGHLSFVLHGRKLTGGFALTQTGPRRWILVKARDDEARPGSDIVAEQPASVRTGRTWQDLTPDAAARLAQRRDQAAVDGEVGPVTFPLRSLARNSPGRRLPPGG